MNQIFDYITEDELTDDLKLIAEVCGMDSVRKLLQHLAGLSFYVPKVSRLDKFINRYLKENKGKSVKNLALELGVSDQFLRNKGHKL